MSTPSLFKEGAKAGLIAGLVFLMLEMIMVPLFLNGSPWGPPRMISAIMLGKDVLPSPENPPTFDVGVIMPAIVLHLVLSIVFAIIIGAVIKNMGMSIAVMVGAVAGLALYFINFYGFTAIFPWFAMARNWVSIFSHIMFGAVAAYAFKKMYTVAAT